MGGSNLDGYATGVWDLDTGKWLYYLGGYFEGTQKTTGGLGICLGESNKIYMRVLGSILLAYDRTRATKSADDNGYLYSNAPTNDYPALFGVYWGPSLAPAADRNTFYMTSWGSKIHKVNDAGEKFTILYSTTVLDPDDPIGMSFAPELNLLFVALRSCRGEVAVISDNGGSLKEVVRLRDPELGGLHTVKWNNGFLYVLADGVEIPEGYVTKKLRDRGYSDIIQGKNRISRYSIGFQKETRVCTIIRE